MASARRAHFTAPWQARVVITIAILTAAKEIIQTHALQITVIPPAQSPRSLHSLRFLAQKEQVSIPLSLAHIHTHTYTQGSLLTVKPLDLFWRHNGAISFDYFTAI